MCFCNVFYDLGHGVCDQVTRRCNCQTFWMENPFSVSNGADYNCGNEIQRLNNFLCFFDVNCNPLTCEQIGAWFM